MATPKKADKKVITSATAINLQTGFRVLREAGINYISNEWNNGNAMAVSFTGGFFAFRKSLPEDKEAAKPLIRLFRDLEKATDIFGENKGNMVIHASGYISFGGRAGDAK